ncbi:ATP phosphoribosyltransferase regulatory subunit [gamma proteobacterium IMCC2047]|nr:ATP phosphoribosyltransferase regulatory subunit [gamma proteobacterium IMCC2047]
MIDSNRWLLPDGIEEVLPPMAGRVESLRRNLLDLYKSWGYDLVIPPFVEFLESLLTGVGSDLDLKTFKVTDQLTGRLMGVRADMTPQVARIDAHSLKHQGPARLCYSGSVLHTRAANMLASRSPIQMGAELYGCSSLAADIEVVSLMLETIKSAGLSDVCLDIGNVAIYRHLVAAADLDKAQENVLFALLQRKDKAELRVFLKDQVSSATAAKHLSVLADLHGDKAVLERAREELVGAAPEVLEGIESLLEMAQAVEQSFPSIPLYFDLSELRGYQYHTGIVFSAYAQGHGQAIAKGGRYDDIGQVFGRARPATGFSTDLKALIDVVAADAEEAAVVIAPAGYEASLLELIRDLREAGHVVVRALAGDVSQAGQHQASQQIIQKDGQWVVEDI